MLKFIAERALKRFSAHYGYDVSYMRRMLDVTPAKFFRFAKLSELAAHRQAAPRDAWYAAKLVGALVEDCGPCVQLNVDMAREAGVPRETVEAVLTNEVTAMADDVALAFRFARAIARRDPSVDELRETVREKWGEAGMIDLALAVQISRVFPMAKYALGYAKTCSRVSIDGVSVDVARAAA